TASAAEDDRSATYIPSRCTGRRARRRGVHGNALCRAGSRSVRTWVAEISAQPAALFERQSGGSAVNSCRLAAFSAALERLPCGLVDAGGEATRVDEFPSLGSIHVGVDHHVFNRSVLRP